MLVVEGEAVLLNSGEGLSKVSFRGYSGTSVNLSSYGFDAPVVYDLAGMEVSASIPLMYKHSQEIGHTEEVTNDQSSISGLGVLSIPNSISKEVEVGLKNKFPYQASMGLMVNDRKKIDYISKGEVVVNNQTFEGPVYVVRDSVLREMTIAPFGRDSNTSFTFVNEEQLMAIKNSEPTPEPITKAPVPKAETIVPVNNIPESVVPVAPVVPVAKSSGVSELFRVQRLLNEHPDYVDVIQNGIENDWSDDQIKNTIKLDMYEKGFKSPKRNPAPEDKKHDLFEARVMLSYGVAITTVEAKYGEKVANEADSLSELTVVEQILYATNQSGGHFTGHSDVENMCEFYKNTGFSGVDLPNLLKKTTETLLEERWKLNPPFAVQHCKEESNKDFRKTERRRITGGGLWNEIDDDGKIPHYNPGKDVRYLSDLKTVGGILVLTREEVINDDQGALRDIMEGMVEDAMLTPDIQLGILMFKAAAANSFWVNTVNSFTGKVLNRANLIEMHAAARQYNEARSTINWNTLVNDKWKLIHSVAKEDDVFEILMQDRLVSNTTANTLQGEKNYMKGRLDPYIFAQMGNTNAFGSGSFVSDETYYLWPTSQRYCPYSINYLKGRKRPVVESISLPGDMLGKGVRGYWDVNVNEREPLTVIRAKD